MSLSASVLPLPLQIISALPTEPSLQLPGCRLRRIQSRESCSDVRASVYTSIQTTTLPSESDSSAAAIHRITDENAEEPARAKLFAAASTSAALADTESDSDLFPSSQSSSSTHNTSPPLTYPFPPPGLSKPLSPPSDMITPDFESSSSTPRELELKSDSLFTSSNTPNHSTSEPDGSVWSTFKMESFLGNYCHTSANNKSITPSLSFHSNNEDGTGTAFDTPLTNNTPRTSPLSLSSMHYNRLKDFAGADESILNLDTAPSSQHPHSSLPFSTSVAVSQINPFMAQRQRQQAFMTNWNRVRQNSRYAPAMPSFFNPIRSQAPGCAWNFLRDPACGGSVNVRVSARKGRDSIFEKALVKLPLTRCRSSCDRIRKDQQSIFGWGIHAWITPTKHCRYCVSDQLLKGVLAYRAFEFERFEEEMRHRREQERSILLMCPSEPEKPVDPDAVFLSFPYRTPSHQDHHDQIQNVPTDPWINYNDFDSTGPVHTCSHSCCDSEAPRSSPDPKDVSAWSQELEKRLLESPVIRDMDDFELEDEDISGFDDEDLDGYYDSEEEEEEEEGYSSSGSSSPTSDGCDCEEDSGCGCPRILIGDPEAKPGIASDVDQASNDLGTKNKSNESAICEKVVMSFWEEEDELDDVDCVRVDVDHIGRMEMVDGGLRETEKWVVDEMRVMEVQVQA